MLSQPGLTTEPLSDGADRPPEPDPPDQGASGGESKPDIAGGNSGLRDSGLPPADATNATDAVLSIPDNTQDERRRRSMRADLIQQRQDYAEQQGPQVSTCVIVLQVKLSVAS